MHNKSVTLILLIVSVFLYLFLAYLGDFRSQIHYYFLILLPLCLIYLFFVLKILKTDFKIHISFNTLLIFALLFRLTLMMTSPVLSDDVYRYLWDGKVIANGFNPYQYAPTDENLELLRDNEIYPNINFPGIATVYPPVAQLFFLINYYMGGTILSWKILLLILEIVLVFIFVRLIDFFSLSRLRLFIVIFNPLLILETYHSGHVELVGILFFWAAVLLFYRNRHNQALSVFFISALVKFLPFLTMIPFLFKKIWRKLLLMLIIFIVVLIPLSLNGVIPMAGFFSYANRWAFNGAIFKIATFILEFFQLRDTSIGTFNLNGHLETFYINSAFYYKIFATLLFSGIVLTQIKKLKITAEFMSITYLQASFVILAALILLTPTLHPWYLLWIIPFFIFLPNWAWITFTLLIQLSYFVLKNYAISGIWEENNFILLAEYLPFYTLLIWEYLDRRKVKGWFL